MNFGDFMCYLYFVFSPGGKMFNLQLGYKFG